MRIRKALASIRAQVRKHRVLSAIAAGRVPSYWWARGRNFGDLVTPYLVERITGRKAINVTTLDLGNVDVLCSTGSILNSLRARNYKVWGSGFIKPAASSPAHPTLHALRGPLSGRIAEGLGWGNPEKYGDPALLLPLLLPARGCAGKLGVAQKIIVIPHYALLDSTTVVHPDTCIVSPMQEVEDVVSCISDAALVISSSLHGLIVAQAYGRPWVWLRDHCGVLYGGDFKFHDFFSSLDVSPPSLECGGEITPQVIEKAIKMAILAPREKTEARQRDLLSSAPEMLGTPALSGMLLAMDVGKTSTGM